ncbi:MAG: hypothetical protein M3065_09585, partial [Actinomycetota bacterium]|nr:hypothetical protein [Actinomycetota bacterium]
MRGRRSTLAVVAAVIAAGALAGLLSATATAAPSCTDNFTGATGGDWGTASNWTSASDTAVHAVPTSSDVACSSVKVAVSETGDTADSLQFTGELDITSGGALTLASAVNPSTAANLLLAGGATLTGAGQSVTVSGTFTWGGGVAGAATLNNGPGAALAIAAGTVTMDNSSTPTLDGGSVSTATAVALGAKLTVAGPAALSTTSTITAGATVAGTGATFTAAGVAAGTTGTYGFGTNSLVLTGGTTTVASGNTLDTGPLSIQGGTLRDDGTVHPSPGGLTLTGGGKLQGTGTVGGTVTNTSGTVSPGDATPGTLTVVGPYSQGGGGTLAIALANSSFGQLAVQGTATLGGTLTLTDTGGFTPGQSSTFQILVSTGARTGTFATIGGPDAGTYYEQYGANGVTLRVTPSSCPASNFDAYAAGGGNWSTAANWSQGAPPAGAQVACWPAAATLTVSDTESADSIQAAGNLSVVGGGTLTLTSTSHGSSVNGLALAPGGELDGPASPAAQTLTVTGNFDWGGGPGSGTAALNAPANSNLAIHQTAGGGGSLTIDGTSSTPAFDGGSVTTNSPVSITNSNFAGVAGATLTVINQPVTFGSAASGVGLTSGTGGTIVAAGINTVGATNTVKSFALHLTTGATSTLAAGTLNVQNLTTDSGTALPVPSGTALNVAAGTISGAISGAGTYTAGLAPTAGTTEIKSGGTLGTEVTVGPGSVTVDSGASYAATATTIGAGTLTLNTGGTTGALAVTGGGQLTGVSGNALVVSGALTWTSGTIANLALNQSGTGFSLSGAATKSLAGGSITTGSPVTIAGTHFQTAGTPTLTTSSTITLSPSVAITGSGANFAAAGLGPASGSGAGTVSTAYNLDGEALQLTGGSTTVASGGTVTSGPLTLTAGKLQDDGTISATGTTLTGGVLDGTGTVTGTVTNSSGTVAPGDAGPGLLSIGGSYSQGGGG